MAMVGGLAWFFPRSVGTWGSNVGTWGSTGPRGVNHHEAPMIWQTEFADTFCISNPTIFFCKGAETDSFFSGSKCDEVEMHLGLRVSRVF